MGAATTEAVAELWRRARSAWPELALAREDFEAHVAARVGALDAEALARICAEDLYLACACARGHGGAIATFSERYGSVIERAVARIDARPSVVDELRQAVLVRLLVAEEAGAPPRIDAYSGRGALGAWVRLAASRYALNARRDGGRSEPRSDVEELGARAAHDGADPAIELLRARCRPVFTAALTGALAALPREQRHLLRLHYLERLTLDALAELLGASRASMHRRITAARDRLFATTCAALRAELGVDTTELDSVIRLVQSDLDLRLSQLLGDEP